MKSMGSQSTEKDTPNDTSSNTKKKSTPLNYIQQNSI